MRSVGVAPFAAGIVFAVLASAGPSQSTVIFQERSAAPPNNACDRACLDAFSDRYMAALAAHDPKRLPFAKDVRFSENSVMLKVGDGLWKTITAKGEPITELHFADVIGQQAGFYGMVREHDITAYYGMRIKIVDGKIAEVETVVDRVRPRPVGVAGTGGGGLGAGGGTGFTPSTPETFRHYPGFGDILPVAQRVGRGRYKDIVNGYWSTMQLNDGVLLSQFSDDCSRVESGFVTSGGNLPNGQRRMTCGEQFATGNYRTDTDVSDRDFLIVDEEKGLVLGRFQINHNAVANTLKNVAGQERPSNQKSPSSFSAMELFKVVNGKLSRIEAVSVTPPYHMPTPWRRVDADIADFSATAAWEGGDK